MSLFIIDDNFLSSGDISEISKQFYALPAIFSPFTIHAEDHDLPKPTDKYSNRMMYCSYDNENNFTNNIAMHILKKFSEKHNIRYDSVSRTRSNNTFFCNDKRPSKPHIDSGDKHMVLLYYVNDSDGDTVLYKNKYEEQNDNDMIVDMRISPKAGRAILFDGGIYHSFYYPNFYDIRSVININIRNMEDKNV